MQPKPAKHNVVYAADIKKPFLAFWHLRWKSPCGHAVPGALFTHGAVPTAHPARHQPPSLEAESWQG